MAKVRMAVVGAGFMGALHARTVAESDVAELAAVVDTRREAGERLAGAYGAQYVATVDEVCADASVDAAVVAVPDRAHEEPACRLLEAGKHVLLEKPMAHTLDAARRIARAAERSGSRLMVAHILRFDPRYAGAAEACASGRIGAPVHVSAGRFGLRQVGVRLAGTSSVCFYMGIHDVDAMQWVTGRAVRRVYARSVSRVMAAAGVPGEDAVFATCELEGGVIGQLHFGWSFPDTFPSGINARLEVVGEDGVIQLDVHDHGLHVLSGAGLEYPDGLHWPETNGRIAGDLAAEVAHFARAVAGGDEFVVGVEDAMRNVAVTDAILRSVAGGRPEDVERVEASAPA